MEGSDRHLSTIPPNHQSDNGFDQGFHPRNTELEASWLALSFEPFQFAADVVEIRWTAFRGNTGTVDECLQDHIPRFIWQHLKDHPSSSCLTLLFSKGLLALRNSLLVQRGVDGLDR